MSEFDEWFKSLNEGGRATYFLGQEGNISKEAWNHQQAKIDAITKQRDSFIKAHHIAMNDVCEHKAKIDELQKELSEMTDRCILRGQEIDLLNRKIYDKDQIIEACLYSDDEDILKWNKDE